MRTFILLMALPIFAMAAQPQGEKKLTPAEKKALTEQIFKQTTELFKDLKLDEKALKAGIEKVVALPRPDKSYKDFGIAVKQDGTPVRLSWNVGATQVSSDGLVSVVGIEYFTIIVLAPEGSTGFGSNKKDLTVVFLPWDKEKGVFAEPAKVSAKPSEMYKGSTEYRHESELPGFMLILPVKK